MTRGAGSGRFIRRCPPSVSVAWRRAAPGNGELQMKLITAGADKQVVDAHFDPHEGMLFVKGRSVSIVEAANEYRIYEAHPHEIADLRKAGYTMRRAPRPGNRLRQWRLRHKLSQRELAERMGVSQQAVSKALRSVSWRVYRQAEESLRTALASLDKADLEE